MFKCTICHSTFYRKSILGYHVNAKHDGLKFDCDSCGKRFSYKSSLLRHMKANHSSQNVGVKVKQHVIEDLPNVDKNSQQHVAYMRQSEREKIQQQTIVLKPNHSAQNVGERVQQHVIEALPNVDDNSQRVVDVQNEREKMRQQKKVFECSLCEATFSRKNILSSHFNARHNDCKLECNLCDKTFTYNYNLLRHKQEKHLVKEHVVLAKKVGSVEDVAKEVDKTQNVGKKMTFEKDEGLEINN